MEKFLELISEILEVEVEEISMETDFREDIEDWDSMKGFAILCMLEDEYGVQIGVPDFLLCRKIGDIFDKTNVGDKE